LKTSFTGSVFVYVSVYVCVSECVCIYVCVCECECVCTRVCEIEITNDPLEETKAICNGLSGIEKSSEEVKKELYEFLINVSLHYQLKYIVINNTQNIWY